MAKKKPEEVKKGLDEWMGTFSDMMTLLMCFFVMLFAMSNVDEAKFDEVSQSFQQNFSIFKGGAKAIGDGVLVSNGVSQLNMLDEYINSTGKVADSDTQNTAETEKIMSMNCIWLWKTLIILRLRRKALRQTVYVSDLTEPCRVSLDYPLFWSQM